MPKKPRVEALIDGIFAVSMTLLVLDIRIPDGVRLDSNADLSGHLAALGQAFEVYVFSFVVLAMFWVAHGIQFRFVARLDKPLLWVNFGFLLLTTTVPFTTNLLSGHGRLSAAVTLFAANLLLLDAGLLLHIHRLRSKPGLATPALTPMLGRSIELRLLAICAVPLIAAAVAQVAPEWGMRCLYLMALAHFSPRRTEEAPDAED